MLIGLTVVFIFDVSNRVYGATNGHGLVEGGGTRKTRAFEFYVTERKSTGECAARQARPVPVRKIGLPSEVARKKRLDRERKTLIRDVLGVTYVNN